MMERPMVHMPVGERYVCWGVAAMRHFHALQERGATKQSNGPDEVDLRNMDGILGTYGEFAVAKWLNMYPSGIIPPYNQHADVGFKVEVRATENPSYGLLLRQKDLDKKPHAPCVLALTEDAGENFKLMGWRYIADGAVGPKIDLKNGREPVWIVRQHDLWPMSELPAAAYHD